MDIKDKIKTLLDEQLNQELSSGLYIVATDIGNTADITLRALAVLNKVDLVICEERKNGSRLLKRYGLEKPLEIINEHNEKENSRELINKIITSKISVALISDGGTPLFADPGNYLVQQCQFFNIPVIPIPGISSLSAALMVSGVGSGSEKFFYYGFLPANKEERLKELFRLRNMSFLNIVFLETPYRLPQLLRDMNKVLNKNRIGLIAYKLTTPEERLFTGTLEELMIMTDGLPKGEFVFILYKQTKKNSRR